MSKERKSMPNKIGKVGRKKMNQEDKKKAIYLSLKTEDIETLGGVEKVQEISLCHLKEKVLQAKK